MVQFQHKLNHLTDTIFAFCLPCSIDMVYTWATNNRLVLNAHNCKAMFISPFVRITVPSLPALKVILTGISIKCITELRLLGITILRDLKWNTQASRTHQFISNMINTINRFGTILNTNICLCIFNAFIMLKLYFGLLMWCWVNKSNEKVINHTSQRCIRVVLQKKSSTLDAEIYAITNLMSFGQLASLRYLLRIHQLSSTKTHHHIYHR